jgi:hypothetical protein
MMQAEALAGMQVMVVREPHAMVPVLMVLEVAEVAVALCQTHLMLLVEVAAALDF